MKFRKKPVVIDAVQITDGTFDAPHPNPEHIAGVIYDPKSRCVRIQTLEGEMRGEIGDWIIRGVKGEFYPCKPDIFAATYELAAEISPHTESAGEWRPIETAPHETYVLLGWQDKDAWISATGFASHGWRRGGISTMSCHGQATHWMPLPAPPTDSLSPPEHPLPVTFEGRK